MARRRLLGPDTVRRSRPAVPAGRTAVRSTAGQRIIAAVGAVVVALTLAAVPATTAHADLAEKKEQKQAEQQRIEQELDDLRIELGGTEADLADTYLALRETELQIPVVQEALDQAEAAAEEARLHDQETAARLAEAEAEEARLTDEVAAGAAELELSADQAGSLALAAYKGSGMPNGVSAVLGAESPQEALDRSYLYGIAMSSQNQQIGGQLDQQAVSVNQSARLSAVRAEVAELKKQAEEALAQKRAAEQEAGDAKAELDALYATQQSQAADLERKKTRYENDEAALAQESAELESEIEGIIAEEKRRAEEAARKAAEAKAAKEAAAEAAARKAAAERRSEAEQEAAAERAEAESRANSSSGGDSSSSSRSAYRYPVDDRISSEFGMRVHPVYGTSKLHGGTDFASACGTPVRATASGTAFFVGSNSVAGRKVMVNHGLSGGTMLSSSYHHLQGFAVSRGEHVDQGEVVGYVGTSGSSTGCHLHFAVYEDSERVDPMGYL